MNRARQWLDEAQQVMDRIEESQMDTIHRAAERMADSIEQERWVHTFGCGHATLPVEEMYPRIGGFVGFHPILELPLTFFTHIYGEMGIRQFLFLERAEGYGREIMKSYTFDPRDCMWLFSHSGINPVNVDIALEAHEIGMDVIACGSHRAYQDRDPRHSSGKTLFEVADVVIDTRAPAADASVSLDHHRDPIGPVSTIAFTSVVWMTLTTVADILEDRGVDLYIHPTHNDPEDETAEDRLERALREYKRRSAGL